MESLVFTVIVSLCTIAVLKSLFNLILLFSSFNKKKSQSQSLSLPPGPLAVPVIGNFLWLGNSLWDLERILRNLRSKYGPILTLRIGSRPAIFVGSHSLAHRALVQNAAVFSDRPKPQPTSQIISSNQHNISSAHYGPTWRLLRRNLTSEILHPSRVRSFSRARNWVLGLLIQRLLKKSDRDNSPPSSTQSSSADVNVMDHFQYAMFCLLVLMCFGDKLDENQIGEIERAQRKQLLSFGRYNILNLWPRLGKIVFRNRWKEFMELRKDQEAVLVPLIRARMEVVEQRRQRRRQQQQQQQEEEKDELRKEGEEEDNNVVAYVDTLMDLELPEEGKRKLDMGEMVSLCSEFLNAGTDTTSTALQWIMANLVKHPDIQAKLYEEICGVVGPTPPPPLGSGQVEEGGVMAIKEDDLRKMRYLKGVVLEGLRRHPPGHFVLPHTVTEEVELGGYLIPKDASVNFMVAEMGWDPEVWDEPMEFKPERFVTTTAATADGNMGGGEKGTTTSMLEVISGSSRQEIKMMPFGAGRRICPAYELAILHLEYFVANLIWYFKWEAVDGNEIDLSEKPQFTIVMKYPLQANISPRFIPE